MLKLVSIFFLIFTPQSYGSGGTMVGNGGGFAEMQAIYLEALLPDYLEHQEQFSDFKNYLQSQPLTPLNFSKECFEPSRDSVLKDPGLIPSCSLYTETDSPLGPEPAAAKHIGATVFATRWISFNNSDSWEVAYEKGFALLSNTQIELRKIPLTWQSKMIASLNIWQINTLTSIETQQQVSLELDTQSIDALNPLKQAIGCDSNATIDVEYLSLKYVKDNKFYAVGPIAWECDTNAFRGEIHITYSSSNEPLNSQLSIKVRRRSTR